MFQKIIRLIIDPVKEHAAIFVGKPHTQGKIQVSCNCQKSDRKTNYKMVKGRNSDAGLVEKLSDLLEA